MDIDIQKGDTISWAIGASAGAYPITKVSKSSVWVAWDAGGEQRETQFALKDILPLIDKGAITHTPAETCPVCEKLRVTRGDYLCSKCRYGT